METNNTKKFYAIFDEKGKNVGIGYYREMHEVRALFRKHMEREDDIEVYDFGGYEPPAEPPKAAPPPEEPRTKKDGILICEDTGEAFKSITDAAQKMGIPYKSVAASIHRRIKAYGYMFKYVNKKQYTVIQDND